MLAWVLANRDSLAVVAAFYLGGGLVTMLYEWWYHRDEEPKVEHQHWPLFWSLLWVAATWPRIVYLRYERHLRGL